MKKIVAYGMTFIMTISSTSFAFAGQRNNMENLDQDTIDTLVASDVYDLNYVTKLADGTKKYSITIDNIQTDITKKKVENGVMYTFDDGYLTDEVLLTDSGDIVMNGKKVRVVEEEETSNQYSLAPRAYIETWETSSTRYAPGPYNVGGALQKSTVYLEQKVKNATLAGLAFVVVTAILGPVAGVGAARGAYSGLEEAYEWAKAARPDLENFFIERRIWTNGKPDTASNPKKYYSWIEVKYYEDKDSNICRGDGSFYALQKITDH